MPRPDDSRGRGSDPTLGRHWHGRCTRLKAHAPHHRPALADPGISLAREIATMKTREYYVYGLTDDDGIVRYIGCSRTPHLRYSAHTTKWRPALTRDAECEHGTRL